MSVFDFIRRGGRLLFVVTINGRPCAIEASKRRRHLIVKNDIVDQMSSTFLE
jgi:hypothetical protein